MTIKDLITECEAYQYSKENFDLVKESSELSLMEQMLESIAYRTENEALIKESAEVFTESFFSDMLDEEQLKALQESVKEKAGKITNKVVTGITNLLKKIVRFFENILMKFQKLEEVTEKALTNAKNLTNEQITAAFDSAKSKADLPLSAKYNTAGKQLGVLKGSLTVDVTEEDAFSTLHHMKQTFESFLDGNLRSAESSLKSMQKAGKVDILTTDLRGKIKELKDLQAKVEGADKKSEGKMIKDGRIDRPDGAFLGGMMKVSGNMIKYYSKAWTFLNAFAQAVAKGAAPKAEKEEKPAE